MVIAAGCASDPRPIPGTPIPVSSATVAMPETPAPTASVAPEPPPPPKVVIKTSNPPAITRIEFDKGSSKPKQEADAILKEVAAVMNAHPEIDLVQVEGHAESKEPKDISQQRADAVRAALIAKGVDGKRLRAKGYRDLCHWGPDRDRRVEFKIVTTNGKPSGIDTGCPEAKAAGVD